MRHLRLNALTLLLLVSASAPSFAVYKCEVDGKTLYSDMPCPNAKKVDLSANVTVTEAEVAAARRRLVQEKAVISRIESEQATRQAAEEKQEQVRARKQAQVKARCTDLAQQAKWSQEDATKATGKSSEKEKAKARRMAEQYEAQCGEKTGPSVH